MGGFDLWNAAIRCRNFFDIQRAGKRRSDLRGNEFGATNGDVVSGIYDGGKTFYFAEYRISRRCWIAVCG